MKGFPCSEFFYFIRSLYGYFHHKYTAVVFKSFSYYYFCMDKKKNKKKIQDTDGEMRHPLVVMPDDNNLPVLSSQALHRYLQEISHYELLSREETEELAKYFQESGDRRCIPIGILQPSPCCKGCHGFSEILDAEFYGSYPGR